MEPINTLEKAIAAAPDIQKSKAERQEKWFQECINNAVKRINTLIGLETIESLSKGVLRWGGFSNANEFSRFEDVIKNAFLPDFYIEISAYTDAHGSVNITYLNEMSLQDFEAQLTEKRKKSKEEFKAKTEKDKNIGFIKKVSKWIFS